MMKLQSFSSVGAFILALLVLTSCNNSEDSGSTGLKGTWQLTSISCYAPTNTDITNPDEVYDVANSGVSPLNVVVSFSGRSIGYQVTAASANCNSGAQVTWTGRYTIPSVDGGSAGRIRMELFGPANVVCTIPTWTESINGIPTPVVLAPNTTVAANEGFDWASGSSTLIMGLPSSWGGSTGNLICLGEFLAI